MIDISDHTQAICELLGYDPSVVEHIELAPGRATVTCYQLNEHGSKFIHTADDHPKKGEAAMCEPVEILVRT